MSAPEIFDRRRRRARRDRAAARFADHDFLVAAIADEILERLDGVTRSFAQALDLGAHDGRLGAALRARGIATVAADAGFGFARAAGGVQCDEDRLPFADASFDLVVSAGVLDQVNDLPGALALVRRALRPDGLFLAGFVGAPSLPRLKAALLAGDMHTGEAAARVHPQIDVRAGGDLLARAGFALPVADSTKLAVSYPDPLRLMRDLRGMAATNLLAGTVPVLRRASLGALADAFAAHRDTEGRVVESFELIFLTGWAPAPSQPAPAARGSGTTSLATALRPRGAR